MEEQLEELKAARKAVKRFGRQAHKNFQGVYEELLEVHFNEVLDEIAFQIETLKEDIKTFNTSEE